MSGRTNVSCFWSSDPERRLEMQVADRCAPVLKGIKASNLITAAVGTWRQARRCLVGCRVICVLLYADARREVLLFYRYDLLEQCLRRPDVREFLAGSGYENCEVGEVLSRLRRRYQQFEGGKIGFPHELGVLLEYPVEDVRGFISNRGKNSLTAGYWKVYGDRERAEQIFLLYDAAREAALRELAAGCVLAQVASF